MLKKILGLVLVRLYLFIGLILCNSLFAADFYEKTNFIFSQSISDLKKIGIPKKSLGVSVAMLSENVYPFQHEFAGINSNQLFNPASVMKLITTRAALDLIGKDYRFQTNLLTTGILKNGVLEGEIFLKGGGDPKLIIEDIEKIVEELRSRGLNEIRGKWVMDDSLFNEPEVNPASFDGQPMKPYNVGPNSAMINFKSTELLIEKKRKKINLSIKPELADVTLRNKLYFVRGSCERNMFLPNYSKGILTIRGRFGNRCKSDNSFISLMKQKDFGYSVFKKAWEKSGGVIEAKIESGVTPKNAKLLYSWTSPRTLSDIVSDINTMSNNTMARTVFLNLSANKNTSGSLKISRSIINNWLVKKGFNFKNMLIDNGSGLSRKVQISPYDMTSFLLNSITQDDAYLWINSLAKAGINGTAKNRFKKMEVKGQAWVKTGSLEEVQACSGYIKTKNKKWIVFSIFVSHKNAEKSKSIIDKLINSLYRI